MIDFYATVADGWIRSDLPPVPIMLPASSFARAVTSPRDSIRVPALPAHLTERAADCGGFVATIKRGGYWFTHEQYVTWLRTWRPQWAATFDFCCEPEIAHDRAAVRERQERTTEQADLFWTKYGRAVPWTWVPTLQGWEVDDYLAHAEQLGPLIRQMQRAYGENSGFRVGIGTLCRRADPATIRQVVRALSDALPQVPWHLWGVKLTLLQETQALPGPVVSIDSAAWNGLFGRDIEVWRASAYSRREYAATVALPAYLAKIGRALRSPKQLSLLCGSVA